MPGSLGCLTASFGTSCSTLTFTVTRKYFEMRLMGRCMHGIRSNGLSEGYVSFLILHFRIRSSDFTLKHFDLDRLENSQIELPMVHRVAVNKPVEPWKHPIVIGDGTTNAITTHSSPSTVNSFSNEDVAEGTADTKPADGAQVVTNLICDFKSIPQTVRKPLSEKYEEIHYSIALIFRPASIDFEVRLEGAAYGSASYNTKWS